MPAASGCANVRTSSSGPVPPCATRVDAVAGISAAADARDGALDVHVAGVHDDVRRRLRDVDLDGRHAREAWRRWDRCAGRASSAAAWRSAGACRPREAGGGGGVSGAVDGAHAARRRGRSGGGGSLADSPPHAAMATATARGRKRRGASGILSRRRRHGRGGESRESRGSSCRARPGAMGHPGVRRTLFRAEKMLPRSVERRLLSWSCHAFRLPRHAGRFGGRRH